MPSGQSGINQGTLDWYAIDLSTHTKTSPITCKKSHTPKHYMASHVFTVKDIFKSAKINCELRRRSYRALSGTAIYVLKSIAYQAGVPRLGALIGFASFRARRGNFCDLCLYKDSMGLVLDEH